MEHLPAANPRLPAPARLPPDRLTETKRGAPRTNLFLMATVVIDGASVPVRVRNLSMTGALIESASLPATGTALILRRGSLAVEGRLMWLADHRAGVEFKAPIDLAKWLPNTPGHELGQAQVDLAIAEARAQLPARPAALQPMIGHAPLWARIADELGLVARRLEALGSDLAGEAPVVVRHAAKLQEIDLAVQTLAHVGRLLTSADPAAALGAIGMADLRRRLEQAAAS